MERTFKDMNYQDFRPAIKRVAKLRMRSIVIGRWELLEVANPKTDFFKGSQFDFYSKN